MYWFLLLNFEVNFITVHVFALPCEVKVHPIFLHVVVDQSFSFFHFVLLRVNFCLWDCGLFFLWIIEITRAVSFARGQRRYVGRSLFLECRGRYKAQSHQPCALGHPPAAVSPQCSEVSAPYVRTGSHKKHLPTATAKGWGAVWDSISCLGIVSNEISDSSLHQNKFFFLKREKKKERKESSKESGFREAAMHSCHPAQPPTHPCLCPPCLSGLQEPVRPCPRTVPARGPCLPAWTWQSFMPAFLSLLFLSHSPCISFSFSYPSLCLHVKGTPFYFFIKKGIFMSMFHLLDPHRENLGLRGFGTA